MQKKLIFLSVLFCLINISHTSFAMERPPAHWKNTSFMQQHYAAAHTLIQIEGKLYDHSNAIQTLPVSVIKKFEVTNVSAAELSLTKPSHNLLTVIHDNKKFTMDLSPTLYKTISQQTPSEQKPLTILAMLDLQNNPHTTQRMHKKFLIESLTDTTKK